LTVFGDLSMSLKYDRYRSIGASGASSAPSTVQDSRREADRSTRWTSTVPPEDLRHGRRQITTSITQTTGAHSLLHDMKDALRATPDNHRVPQRPLPPRGHRLRPLPQRAGRPQAPLPGHPRPGPLRPRPATLEQQVEGRPQRVRPALRRPSCRRTGVGQPDQPLTTSPKRWKTPNS
jgi:hypothetical protein